MNVKILVVDDEDSIRKLLSTRFTREGWAVQTADDGAKAVESVKDQHPIVILTDIKMPIVDGFQLIERIRAVGVECPIIMITGHGEKEGAIEAIHKGAFDYLEKPFEMNEIAQVVRRAIEHETLRVTNLQLVKDLEVANRKLSTQLEVKTELLDRTMVGQSDAQGLIGVSDHISHVRAMARTLAESFIGENDPVVLITGESGVGKEVVARYMHGVAFEKGKPFVAINCAAFPDNLLESELFGYEKGAFTGAMSRKLGLFELASGGTLFLDEIGEMELKMQAKLLRVLQERVIRRLGGTADITVRPHIVAATNRDLAKAVEQGTFREDLYYRLNTLPLAIAPLRSRTEDIEVLANHFLKKMTAARNKKFTAFSPNALKVLLSYRWPGNVRELHSVIERAVILEKGSILELSHLRQESLHATRKTDVKTAASATKENGGAVVLHLPINSTKSLSVLRKEMDNKLVRQVIMDTLTHENGNVSSVARKLHLDRANLLRMLKRFHIDPELFRDAKAS